MRKPEPRVFEFILDQHKCEPSRAVYFDDLKENVYIANRLGIEAVLFDDDSKAKLWWKRWQAAVYESVSTN
jgi:FMN phosphatase YigB (HAD superfamily)